MTHDLGNLTQVIAFLVAIMVLAQACADEGVFEVLGGRMARIAGGSSTRLLAWSVGLAAVVTVVLSLDATVVLLTPVLIAASARGHIAPTRTPRCDWPTPDRPCSRYPT